MSDKRVTRWLAFLMFLVVFGIYFRTMAPTTSFWDCGEFIACSFTLGIPHPPGSPLFIMLGRVFSMFPIEGFLKAWGWLPEYADGAARVNIMSPLAGALSALFCYLVILRLIRGWQGPLGTVKERWSDHVGAVAGTLIFALADSNWFNAVEGEVYAYAIFLMMLALYLGLVWADSIGKPIHLPLALFLAYLMGLASGLHLLCLLVLPTIAFIGLFTYVKDRYDAWKIVGAAALLVIGAYFAMHAMNARRLLGDEWAEPASLYGLSEDPMAYLQISIVLAVIFGVAGVVVTFLTKTVKTRDIWAAIFVAGAAAATVQSLTGVFFWVENVQPFPTSRVVGALGLLVILYFLSQSRERPSIPILKGYHLLVGMLLLVVVGYSTYLFLMIRSGLNPTIDENNPENWKNLFDFLARKQYGNEDMSMIIFSRKASMQYQFWDMFIKYLLHQFPMSISGALFDWKLTFRSAMEVSYFGMRVPDFPLLLMFLGLGWHFNADRKRFFGMLALFIISGLGLVIYLNMPDPQPRERHYVFTGAISVMAIWMGMGVTGLIRTASSWLPASVPEWLRTKFLPVLMALIGFAVPVWFLLGYPLVDEYSGDFSVRYSNFVKHDRRYDTVGYDYAYNILQSCDKDAVLFTNGDNDTFPLWYVQEVAGVRKDVRVVNLSLLNTDWYIQQLRDNEPKLPMSASWTNDWITNTLCGNTLESLISSGRIDLTPNGTPYDENGRVVGWVTKPVTAGRVDSAYIELKNGEIRRGIVGVPVTGNTVLKEYGKAAWDTIPDAEVRVRLIGQSFPGITWDMPASPEYRVLRVQDVMIFKILDWVKWQRPVYFAVTVASDNLIGLDKYLRMEGMVLRITNQVDSTYMEGRGSYALDIERSKHNLDNVYQIRNMMDQRIYKDDNMLKLVSNYRSAYLRLAEKQIDTGDTLGARETLVKFNQRLPRDWRGAYYGATVARRGGAQLDSLTQGYLREASQALLNELPTMHVFDIYSLERVRMTAQLLRSTGQEQEAIRLLLATDPYLQKPSPLSGISSADRIGLFFEASTIYDQVGDIQNAREMLERCRNLLMVIPNTAEANQEFARTFRTDAMTLAGEVNRRIADLEQRARQTTPRSDSLPGR